MARRSFRKWLALPEEERSRAAKIGLWLTGALQQVAIGALGGAGGNMLSG